MSEDANQGGGDLKCLCTCHKSQVVCKFVKICQKKKIFFAIVKKLPKSVKKFRIISNYFKFFKKQNYNLRVRFEKSENARRTEHVRRAAARPKHVLRLALHQARAGRVDAGEPAAHLPAAVAKARPGRQRQHLVAHRRPVYAHARLHVDRAASGEQEASRGDGNRRVLVKDDLERDQGM